MLCGRLGKKNLGECIEQLNNTNTVILYCCKISTRKDPEKEKKSLFFILYCELLMVLVDAVLLIMDH